MTELYRWDALSPHRAGALLGGFDAPWWIAGGWAIDLFLGRQTREHGDLDVAVLRGDQERLRRHLADWDLHVAHDGALTPWAAGDWLAAPRHQFWARPRPDAGWALEILLEDHTGDEWIFRRDASVTRPFTQFGRTTADGVPYICAEVALLYKASAPGEERNARDFDAAAPALDAAARAWLRGAVDALYPAHAWLPRLT